MVAGTESGGWTMAQVWGIQQSVTLPSDHLNVRGSHRENSPLNPQRSLKHSAEADGLYLPKAD